MGAVTVGQMDYLIGSRYRTEHGRSRQPDAALETAELGRRDGEPCVIFRSREGDRLLRLIRKNEWETSAHAPNGPGSELQKGSISEDEWHLIYPDENPDTVCSFVLGLFYELQHFRANFRVRLSLEEDLHGAAVYAASFLGIEMSVLDRNLVNRSMTPWNRSGDKTMARGR